MTNLLDETLDKLLTHNKTYHDVEWIGNRKTYAITWKEFVKIANIKYDDGFGGHEIIGDLVVVGKDWWLAREEYDGSEWWSFKTMPIKPKNPKTFTELKIKNYAYDMEELHGEKTK